MTCTFFGHSDTPAEIRGRLKETVIDLIENHGADLFYVGSHGSFDRISASVLKELSSIYPHIRYYVVLAYLPTSDYKDIPTLFPEGIETVPKRFEINFRNKFMVEQSDTVIAYITHSYGGAAKFAEMAHKKKKTVINLAEKKPPDLLGR